MAQKQKKRFLAGITAAKSLRSQVNSSLKVRQARLEARRLAQKARLKKMGLVGRRLGRHRVPEGQVDVQLGEELAESFRELKVDVLFCAGSSTITEIAVIASRQSVP